MAGSELAGEIAPRDSRIPEEAAQAGRCGPFGVYVHVPFCRVRCGYCDFTTYAPGDLTGYGDDLAAYPSLAAAELDLAVGVLQGSLRPADTVFFGGGTPTLLPSAQLRGLLEGIRERFGLVEGAEITVEANPDTVTGELADQLAEAGVTRVSLGVQSVVPTVLSVLERTHDPAQVPATVQAVRSAGLEVSVDLIYGTPGESHQDWAATLDAALALEPDHVSAYALVIEEGTSMARRVRRGELPGTDEDTQARRYEMADEALAAAGYAWYELSNWARPTARASLATCRHNLGYWGGGQWWGVGPGAHSHVGGLRWWNVRHPRAYAERLRAGESPAQARERLTPEQQYDEWVLLGIRLADGLPPAGVHEAGLAAVPSLCADGLVQRVGDPDRVILTRQGRLLADLVTRRLLGW